METSSRRTGRVDKIRKARACETCRRKKVRCDGKRPNCSSCTAFSFSCVYEDVSLSSHRIDRHSSPSYTEGLERRVKSLERQLEQKNSHLTSSEYRSNTLFPDSRYNDFEFSQESALKEPASSLKGTSFIDNDSSTAHPQNLLTSNDGTVRFFGASSGFASRALPAHNGTEPQPRRMFREPRNKYIAVQNSIKSWIPRTLSDNFQQRAFQSLPPRQEASLLVQEFLSTFNQVIPLVEDVSFLRLVEKQYSWNPDDSSSWWILFNVVLAFSYAERAKSSLDNSGNWEKSLGHIKNALDAVMGLFLQISDLCAVQGLLGLALYFQGTPNPQALFMFAAMALRLAHSIGLHRNIKSGLTNVEIEARRRTFWIAFILDADISIRVGRPPLQDLDDYDIPMPAGIPDDGRGIINIDGVSMNFFLRSAQFALIQRRVYQHLYTFAALQEPNEAMIKSAHDCEAALLQWRRSTPDLPQLREDRPYQTNYLLRFLLRLHLAYHSCYANLRQLPLSTAIASMKMSTTHIAEAEEHVSSLMSRSLDSARAAVNLIPQVRMLGSEYQWNVLYFIASASIPLLREICVNPIHHNAVSDLSSVHDVINYLKKSRADEPGTYIDYILNACSDLENSARRAMFQSRRRENHPTNSVENQDLTGQAMDMLRSSPPQHVQAGLASYNPGEVFNDYDAGSRSFQPPCQDLESIMNSQIPFPLFWNWQDMASDISPTMNFDQSH